MRSMRWMIRSAAGPWLLVAEQLSGLLPRKPPVDLGPFPVGLAVPSVDLPLQRLQIRNPPVPQTLPRDQTEFDFRLIEPAPVLRSVMDGEPVPKRSALFLAEVSDQRLAAVDIQVIHDEVDGVGLRVVLDDA